MQEIVLLLSSIAGACTAAAFKKFPKNKGNIISLGANIHIKNQINSLRLEKEILNKTISRLYHYDTEMSKIQRDKLLLRYQNQLGIVLARIEKLEAASKHPDLGPLGDGLITLMDQKLSSLDKRLHEISSKINVANMPPQEIKLSQAKPKPETKLQEEIKDVTPEHEKKEEKVEKIQPKIAVPSPRKFELTTLTELPDKIPDFFLKNTIVQPVQEIKQEQKKIEIVESSTGTAQLEKPKTSEMQPLQAPEVKQPEPEIKHPESEVKKQHKVNLPIDDEEEDDDDLDKIKGEIMKTLSKLEQAEVE